MDVSGGRAGGGTADEAPNAPAEALMVFLMRFPPRFDVPSSHLRFSLWHRLQGGWPGRPLLSLWQRQIHIETADSRHPRRRQRLTGRTSTCGGGSCSRPAIRASSGRWPSA